MCYVEKIEKIKNIMIEEILGRCDENGGITFTTPIEIGGDYEVITDILYDGTVLAVDDMGNECEGNIHSYPVEAIAAIYDGVETTDFETFQLISEEEV
jgi:hypothetical protein